MDAEMERWRSFFAQAEGDLWAIIDQAILIAAADFPAEFKHKRCEIAEVLFARRRIPSPPSRSIEATRLSGSVITNATADGEKRTSQTWMEEVNGSMHPNTAQIELKRTDTHSHEIVSKTSANGVHIMHEDKSVELHRCLQNGDDSRESSKDSGVLDSVSMIKDVITDPANQNENDLLRSLRVLEHLDINVGILKATDIGREVNKFRKHSSVHVRNLVKQLVRTWKGIVDEWARNTEDDGSLNESRGQDVKGKEAQMQASMQLTKTLNTTNTDSRSTGPISSFFMNLSCAC
ncbi:hypothetical protein KP509_31G055300 [Ceratopteris richardii]|uniref:TFIIS N-terminal domain-containing protein n=1 Tax=Ceratopteris richardii TaxID=49495 RepID=A0A8T2QZH6_CERRI|nr:hypothetical protein KP509_31G055300 [Ceratopteris richardii]